MRNSVITEIDHWSGKVVAEVTEYEFHESPQIKINGETFVVIRDERRQEDGFVISHEMTIKKLIPIKTQP
jgi:hypothetical protein